MPVHHYMLDDLLGALLSVAVFPLFVLAPGYVAAWLLDLFDFRRRTAAFRLAFSVALSIAICPILTYLLGRFAGMPAVWTMYAIAGAAFLVLAARDRVWRSLTRSDAIFAGAAAVWLAVCVLSLIDLQLGDKLYYPTSTIDYSVRTAFVHSISTTGIPPENPFFAAGHPVHLRYHYFWLMMCSLADQLGGAAISARQAQIGGTFWIGIGILSLLAIYLRMFATRTAPLRARLWTGVALLAITGLDLIPTLFFALLYARGLIPFALPSVEWWNEHVDWFVYTTLWAPHAAAAMIACFVGFLLLWHAGESRRYVLPAALALASSVGASIYVTFVFAIFLSLWTAVTLWKKWYRETAVLCCAGVATCLLALPYLRDLAGPGAGGPLFTFTVRDFSLAALVPTGSLPATWRRILVNGALLPLNYLLEFGLFFFIARFKWKQHRATGEPLSRRDLALGLMAITSTLACTFLRSSVIGCNDLGWRGFLIAEFVLLLWAVDLFRERATLSFLLPVQRQLLTICFAIGLAGTVVDLGITRLFPLMADRGVVPPMEWMGSDRAMGARTYAARAAYDWLKSTTPESAAIQANPNVVVNDILGAVYSDRPTVAGATNCVTAFGGDPKECAPIVSRILEAFPSAGPAGDLRGVCEMLPVNSVVAKDTDAVWRNRKSWVWTEEPAYANDYFRVFRCGTPAGAVAKR